MMFSLGKVLDCWREYLVGKGAFGKIDVLTASTGNLITDILCQKNPFSTAFEALLWE